MKTWIVSNVDGEVVVCDEDGDVRFSGTNKWALLQLARSLARAEELKSQLDEQSEELDKLRRRVSELETAAIGGGS